MQLRMGEVADLVRGASGTQEQDYATRAGKTLLDSFINTVVTNGFSGNSSDPIHNVRETLGLAKDIAGVQDDKEKRLIDEIKELREQNKQLHDVKTQGNMSDMAKMLEAFMGIVNTSNDKSDKMYGMMFNMVKEMYQGHKGNESEDILKKIGVDTIISRINADPREEFDRQRKYWYEIYKAENNNNADIMSLEKWKAQKNIELEEKKIDLEVQRQERDDTRAERAADRQNRMIENLALAVTGMASKNNSTKEEMEQALSAGMVRVVCPNCNDEFVLTQVKDNISCPFCRTQLSLGQQSA